MSLIPKINTVTGNETLGKINSSDIEPGIADAHYTHEQATPAAVWIVNHGLNKYPSVRVVNSAGNDVMGDIETVDNDTVILRFHAGFSGKAYFN